MFKFKTTKLKDSFKKSPRSLAKHSFLLFLAMFLIIAFLGGFIFYYYQYCLSLEDIDELGGAKPLKFDTERQERILQEWQRRDESFDSTTSKQYSDPFHID